MYLVSVWYQGHCWQHRLVVALLVVGTLVQFGCRSREVLRVCREQWRETSKILGVGAACVHVGRSLKVGLEGW